jgi:hypothetical protein
MARKSIRGLGANLYAPPTDNNEHQHTSGPPHQPTSDDSQAKATFYLSPETLDDLDRAWLTRRRSDRRISKSSLVEQALREFLAKAAAA